MIANAPQIQMAKTGRLLVIDALVLIWAASDADEWKNRIVNIPEP